MRIWSGADAEEKRSVGWDGKFLHISKQSGKVKLMSRILAVLFSLCAVFLASCANTKTTVDYYNGPRAQLFGQYARAPEGAPQVVIQALAAGNAIQRAPYEYGGGHGSASWGLDCSGSVSYVLRRCGLIHGSLPSDGFRDYGSSGAGKWITVFAKDGHVFMTIAGLRLDTSSGGKGDTGPRWSVKPRRVSGFNVRHPGGL